MKRSIGGVLYGIGGGFVALSGTTLAGAINENEASQRVSIEACAASLSPELTQNTEIPEPCDGFRFNGTKTTQKIFVDGVMNKTVTVEFDLPSSDDFSAYANEAVITDARRNEMNQSLVVITTALWALIGVALPPNTQAGNKLITAEE